MITLEFTAKELEGAKEIRRKVKGIPEQFNTDFYLARWWRAYHGNLPYIERRMAELFAHRRAIEYDRLSIDQFLVEMEFAKKTFERFTVSSFQTRFSGNLCVYVQKMEDTDLDKIMKVMPLSYVINSYFIQQEMFTRRILEKEAETGSPAAAIIIMDLKGLNISEFINPLGGPSRLARLVCKLLLINPPTVLNVLWYVMKMVVDKSMRNKLQILHDPSELHELLQPEAIPEEFGGTWHDDTGYASLTESVCRKGLYVGSKEAFDVRQLWLQNGFESIPDSTTIALKGKETREITMLCENDKCSLLWQFSVSSDVEFEIVIYEDADEICVWPKLTTTSIRVPEQGHVSCKHGRYIVRFTNPTSSWLPLKITYVLEFSRNQLR